MPPEIGKKQKEWLASRARGKSLQNNLRASSFGHPCERFHYYSLTEYRPPVDVGLQAIFDLGLVHENHVNDQLQQMGFQVEGKQQEFRLENPLVTAHIDGKLSEDGKEWFPFDSKSINDYDFDALNSAEDFIHSKKVHQRNYPSQILLYMLVVGAEYGALILSNKQTGMIKDIWFDFNQSDHLRILDESIERAKRVYAAHEKKEPGPRTTDLELCSKCDFKAICLPDILNNPNIHVIDSPELIEMLERRSQVQEGKKEYDQLDRRIKALLEPVPAGEKICGDWIIQITERERAGYTVEPGTTRTTKFAKAS